MSRELKVDEEAFTTEVAWLNKMPAVSPETAVIQVTALLGAVVLRRTCFDRYQESVVPAQGVEQASIMVDAAKLTAALKTVSGPIIVHIGDDQLSITMVSGARTVRLRAASLTFPEWPKFEPTGDRVAMGAIQLTRALTSVGTDESIPSLLSVAFDKGAMVTTDRFRLTRIGYDKSGFAASVPSGALRTFARNEGVVYVQPGRCENPDFGGDAPWVELTGSGRTVTTVTSDTEFPKWRQLIPENCPVSVAARRDDLLAAISGEEVTLTVTPPVDEADEMDGGTMTVTSITDGMEVEQTIRLNNSIRHELDGPLSVTLRTKYVKECLRNVGSALVLFDATAPGKPVMFRDITENDLHLIMPVRKADAS